MFVTRSCSERSRQQLWLGFRSRIRRAQDKPSVRASKFTHLQRDGSAVIEKRVGL
jgi:hypothetical protein